MNRITTIATLAILLAIHSAPEGPLALCPELQKSRHKAPPGQRNVSA